LPFTQDQVALRGSAIECRIYAEDPANNFFPSPGRIVQLAEPSGPGVRLDSGIYPGWTVPLDYDPMLSKLVVWADTRGHAIERMLRALDEYHIAGIKTNIPLFRLILNDPSFRAGDLHTGYLDELLKAPLDMNPSPAPELAAIAALVVSKLSKTDDNEEARSAVSHWLTSGRGELLR
jgi:acetyl-CoA carboxylase biotin carboxylase subunit